MPPQGSWDGDEIHSFFRDGAEHAGAGFAAPARVETVLASVRATGTYTQTIEELTVGARLAWRNSVHCLGRASWATLSVRDARQAHTADEVFEVCVEHLRQATNGGRVRALLTAMAPDEPDRPGPRLLNQQLVQYAGYRQPDGRVVGDPLTVGLTELARQLGWPGGNSPFDVLPLLVDAGDGEIRWYETPPDAVLQVPLRHPDLPWFSRLGLRWYANPAICNQRLRIGGITYPAAPFSGWYTATEIGARSLSDTDRYDMLPAIADWMGLDRRSSRGLWRDRALLELVTAVLHSFDEDGVTIVDHHFAAASFVRHEARERAAGRTVPACWRSLMAPTAASTTATFARHYVDEIRLPNFFPHDAASTQHCVTSRPADSPR